MASQWCRFCQVAMYPHSGHRLCPHCLGLAHLVEDIENPCNATSLLPLEEHRCRVKLVEDFALNKTVAHPLPTQVKESRHASKQSWSLKHERSPITVWDGALGSRLIVGSIAQKIRDSRTGWTGLRLSVQPLAQLQCYTSWVWPLRVNCLHNRERGWVHQMCAHCSIGGSVGLSGDVEGEYKLNSSLCWLESDQDSMPDNDTS